MVLVLHLARLSMVHHHVHIASTVPTKLPGQQQTCAHLTERAPDALTGLAPGPRPQNELAAKSFLFSPPHLVPGPLEGGQVSGTGQATALS